MHRTKRESMGTESRIPVMTKKTQRRESTATRTVSRPISQLGDKKSNAPPRKKLDYFAYVNNFLTENGKSAPFPNRLKSYDQLHFVEAASSLLSLIDPRFEPLVRTTKLDHEFCDIMEILGYPYDVRQYYHQPIGTERNVGPTADPLRWLVHLITAYQPYKDMNPLDKKYDETTQQKLDFFRNVIEAFRLWLQGKDQDADEIMNNVFLNSDDSVERENELLQDQYEKLMNERNILNNLDDPCSFIINEINRLNEEKIRKDAEFNQLSQRRIELQESIKHIEDQSNELTEHLKGFQQEVDSLNQKVKELPYNLDTIEEMVRKPELIIFETDNEKKEIEKMQKQITENNKQFKDQCEALSLIAHDMNEIIRELNIGAPIKINDNGSGTNELFGTNLDEIVQTILSNRPDMQQVEIEKAKINSERFEIEREMEELKREEESLMFELETSNNDGGKIDKLNKKLIDAQNENRKLTREIQNDQDAVKVHINKLDEKYKMVTSHISEKLEAYLKELQRVQTEVQ
ncbi:hypothetical protein TRFO_02232 [Tritrichomonas foetus]|uniref:Uncharacterized protein n=1 Tax=Tritrichomonas foetus TaxID=1144522 RepID=A0A1J4J9A2_9EUKA|nr:hypothetical protein TRFO_02232 [Tritrichomonas foetus]|eukprot:OHS95249.1 hypothetical protein TRFO_02232 [Tritrichomonas foetus]